MAAIIPARAAADPGAIAITGDGRPLTFGELDERSSRLAQALAGLGVRRGDRVAYLDQNATEFWETMFATAKLGAHPAAGPGGQLDDAELIAFCRQRLAHYKCPARIEWVEALPRNPSGKVLRRKLREPYWQDLDRQVG